MELGYVYCSQCICFTIQKRRDRVAIEILALVFPVLLFLFKYVMPAWAEEVYTNKKREREQVKIEAIHFPVDLLFVAVSYTIPKIIEVTSQLAVMDKLTEDMMSEYQRLIQCILVYGAESFLCLLLVPFFVFLTKSAENNYFKKKRRWILQAFAAYLIAGGLIWVSVFKA